MREFQLMQALESAGTTHFDFKKGVRRSDNKNVYVYYLTKFNNDIKSKLEIELANIKGLKYTFGTSRAQYAPEIEEAILIRESFK